MLNRDEGDLPRESEDAAGSLFAGECEVAAAAVAATSPLVRGRQIICPSRCHDRDTPRSAPTSCARPIPITARLVTCRQESPANDFAPDRATVASARDSDEPSADPPSPPATAQWAVWGPRPGTDGIDGRAVPAW